MESGVYVITNNVNGKKYFGSTICFVKRKESHWWHLRNGKHGNRHLQRAWNKYGENSFDFEIVICCQPEYLLIVEDYYISQNKDGYNINESATAPGLRRKRTLKSREKQSLSMIKSWENKNPSEISRPGKLWHKDGEKFRVCVYYYGEKIFIGIYDSEEEAQHKSDEVHELLANNTHPIMAKDVKEKGVEKLPNGKYRARITKDGKKITLGTFVHEDEARKAYLNAFYEKRKSRFLTNVSVSGERVYLGYCATKEESKKVRLDYLKSVGCQEDVCVMEV